MHTDGLSKPTFVLKLVVMGVAGSGKTTLGRALATAVNADFLDADDFHSPAAKAKMARGEALTDDERQPWLDRLAAELRARPRVVLACSALKRSYREVLRVGEVRFLFLDVPEPLLRQRLQRRSGHYAGESLLGSQLTTLEQPDPEEQAVRTLAIRAEMTPEDELTASMNLLGWGDGPQTDELT